MQIRGAHLSIELDVWTLPSLALADPAIPGPSAPDPSTRAGWWPRLGEKCWSCSQGAREANALGNHSHWGETQELVWRTTRE